MIYVRDIERKNRSLQTLFWGYPVLLNELTAMNYSFSEPIHTTVLNYSNRAQLGAHVNKDSKSALIFKLREGEITIALKVPFSNVDGVSTFRLSSMIPPLSFVNRFVK